MRYCMVLVTCGQEEAAKTLAQNIVKKQLAACVQLHPVTSIYTWEGNLQSDPEIRLVIKTRKTLYPALEKFILDCHEYEVPQIIQVDIQDGLPEYLEWIDQNTPDRPARG